LVSRSGVFGGQQLPQGSYHEFRPDHSAVGLLDSIGVSEENAASSVGTDSFFALLTADASAWE
jgi:hypothetical protein